MTSAVTVILFLGLSPRNTLRNPQLNRLHFESPQNPPPVTLELFHETLFWKRSPKQPTTAHPRSKSTNFEVHYKPSISVLCQLRYGRRPSKILNIVAINGLPPVPPTARPDTKKRTAQRVVTGTKHQEPHANVLLVPQFRATPCHRVAEKVVLPSRSGRPLILFRCTSKPG